MNGSRRITRDRVWRVGAALVLAVTLPLAGQARPTSADDLYTIDEFSIARKDNEQVRPRISGKYVVWQDYRNLDGKVYSETLANADIYGKNLDNNDEFKVTTNGTAARPAISGSRVVYSDSRNVPNGLDIRGFNVSNSDNFDVVERTGEQDYPAIDGSLVVWQDNRTGNWDIRGFDVEKDDNFEVIVRDADQRKPAISGKIVVWEDYRKSPTEPDIYMIDLNTDDRSRVTENGESRDPDISGDWITYRSGDPNGDSQRIRLYNYKTGERRTITEGLRLSGGPSISGNLVVWSDRRNDEDYNIWGYDIAANQQFRVTGADKDQINPDVDGLTVVWEDRRNNDREIRGARLTKSQTPSATATPGAPAPPPVSGPCGFTLGFKLLRDQIPGVVGDCIENEWFKMDDGNSLQRTTGGLMVWRKADNWTAFTNGSVTWLNGPCGLQIRPNQGPFYGWEGRVGAGCI